MTHSTFSGHGNLVFFVQSIVELFDLHTSTNLNRSSPIRLILLVVPLDELKLCQSFFVSKVVNKIDLNALEVMHP